MIDSYVLDNRNVGVMNYQRALTRNLTELYIFEPHSSILSKNGLPGELLHLSQNGFGDLGYNVVPRVH
jgi:hypothetical protein